MARRANWGQVGALVVKLASLKLVVKGVHQRVGGEKMTPWSGGNDIQLG
jgi:hypothetical protein